MALPPGYLIILEAASALGLRQRGFSRNDAIEIETYLNAHGWSVVPAWMAVDPPAGVVVEDDVH
jgi:hypothetical protein